MRDHEGDYFGTWRERNLGERRAVLAQISGKRKKIGGSGGKGKGTDR